MAKQWTLTGTTPAEADTTFKSVRQAIGRATNELEEAAALLDRLADALGEESGHAHDRVQITAAQCYRDKLNDTADQLCRWFGACTEEV